MREFLSENKIEFTDHNIRYDEAARQKILDMFGAELVPVTFVDDQVIIGFDQAKLETLLDLGQPKNVR